MISARPDLGEALAALARATTSLANGGALQPTLDEVTEAVAHGTGAEVAAVWLPEPDGSFVARAVAASGALAAEVEGFRAESREAAAQFVRDAVGPDAIGLSLALDGTDRDSGTLELARGGEAFDLEGERIASLAADLAGLAVRLCHDGSNGGLDGSRALDVAGDALASVSEDEHATARIARLAVDASGAEGALVWRVRGPDLEPVGATGSLEPGNLQLDGELERAARSLVDDPIPVAVGGDPRSGVIVTLPLGQPPLGALQLRFPRRRTLDDHDLARLASFAVRAAHALRSVERAHSLALELDRSRALLSVVGEAIARLSLAHTLETAIERVAELLGTGRAAVYLWEGDDVVVAASSEIEGQHDVIARALLELVVNARLGGAIVEVDDIGTDERLEAAHAQAAESRIGPVLALPLVVKDAPIGLLAVYPRRTRRLTANESALLLALAAQLAVVVQNARLHEDLKKAGADREAALASEREKSNLLSAQYDISRSFAQTLSLDTTLRVLAESIVTLLGVDAAVIRMPDERGELVARCIEVNDERVGPAVRALLGRPQRLPRRDLLALLERKEPLVLEAKRAEEFGDALAMLAPFLRKGSSAALIPIATPAELLATLTIVSLHPGRPVAGEIAETALSIAGQAALAIDNARLYGQQKAFADAMQRSLLPSAPPELPGLELGDVYESSARVEVGGDVYDYLTLGDGRLAVVLGDVMGHGVDATADMAMAKFVFRSLARDHLDPGEFLAAANEVVSSEIAPGKFITMVELVIDAERGEVLCASAGHPVPRLVLPDGTVEEISAGGLALGVDSPQAYETVRAGFPPGAIVVAYTDGVVEARRAGELFGLARFDALLAERRKLSPKEIATAALDACREWTDGELTDDFAVVVIKRAG